MGKESILIVMEINISVGLKMIKNQIVTANLYSILDPNIKVESKMENIMEKAI